jgi:hypothetical protein
MLARRREPLEKERRMLPEVPEGRKMLARWREPLEPGVPSFRVPEGRKMLARRSEPLESRPSHRFESRRDGRC